MVIISVVIIDFGKLSKKIIKASRYGSVQMQIQSMHQSLKWTQGRKIMDQKKLWDKMWPKS